ncbi:MAG TPA: Ig-like domain-containing protein, partial [Nitrospirota bacterium]|nr:Ig-like domain-containing protein [Nitrospirota bacterium]
MLGKITERLFVAVLLSMMAAGCTGGGVSLTEIRLESIAIQPADPSVAVNINKQFTATGSYSDASTQNLTAMVTWSSSNTGVATISNSATSRGLATAVSAGTTTITAAAGSLSASTVLTVTSAFSHPTVGAIRWDGWLGEGDSVGKQLDKDLSPNHWHYRVPFYATEVSANQVIINASTQDIIDQEIAYAKNAGINYFAYVLYPNSSLETALNLHLSSTHKNDVNYCFIFDENFLGAMTTSNVNWVIARFKDANYQKVMSGR